MKKCKKTIIAVIFSFLFINFSFSLANYQVTNEDKAFVDILVEKVWDLEKKSPGISQKFVLILPKLENKYESQWRFRFAFLLWALCERLNWWACEGENSTISNNSLRDISKFQYVYKVWPGQEFSDLNQIPRENIQKSTIILVNYRPEPYKNKFIINVSATEDQPFVLLWIADSDGNLPKIDWNNATTRTELDYRNEERSLIKIWWSSKPSENIKPNWIYIENFDIYGARDGAGFTDDGGNKKSYSKNATCIHLEYGNHVFIKNNNIHDCSNWIFTTHFTDNIVIQWNNIWNNGNINDGYCHNTYTESQNIVYENNFMGDLLAGSKWTNLKDRSAGTIIRYNWIEGGNRQLDLVETTHEELLNLPQYDETFIYGNILIEKRDEWNQQIMHYGGDGDNKNFYRKWDLYFFNNTVISKRSNYTTLINLSLNEANLFASQNIIYTTAGPKNFALSDGRGNISLKNNILPPEWKNTHNASFEWTVNSIDNIETSNIWFINIWQNNFHLNENSIAKNKWTTPPKSVSFEFWKNGQTIERKSTWSLWAFE